MATTGCGVEVGAYPGVVTYSAGVYDYPSDAYIATTEPFYYEGHASYWYGGRWYYRDGNHWGHYDREPAALQQHRMQAPPARHQYEPSGARPGPSGGRSGGRSGR